jgi:GNAT superfamily N-acetyltransferase
VRADGDNVVPTVGEFVGPWYTWWPGDPLPTLPVLPGFAAALLIDDTALATLSALSVAEIAARRANGDRPYLATVAGAGVGWGWSATRHLSIGELGIERALPPTDRYLWAFETLPDWRGRGIYPRLLQAILRHEAGEGARSWIGHDPGNAASARGIAKAGFGRVGAIHRAPDGGYLLVPSGPLDRARIGAPLLGARVLTEERR